MLSTLIKFGLTLTVCLVTFGAESAHAQQTGPPPPGNRDPFEEARERQRREAQLRSAERIRPAEKKDSPSLETVTKRLRDDFKQIQILRNNVVRHLLAEKPLDYKFIASQTEEINKRATRLAEHLEHKADEVDKKETEQIVIADDKLKNALVTMCQRIDSFTENPSFENPDVLNLVQAERARRDLQNVVQLSSAIVKVAERLKKTPDK